MRLKLLAVVAASFMTAACSLFVDETPQKAYAALAAKDYVTAEKLYGDMLKSDANNPWALFNLGVVYQNTGRLPQAKANYQKVVQLNPQDKVGETTDGKGTGVTLADLAKQNLAALPK